MKTIPVHDFAARESIPKFEVMPWRKEVSANAALPHRHNYYELLVFTKGKAEHEIDFTSYAVTAPAIHFISANSVHVVKRKPGSEGFSILFAAEFLPKGSSPQDFGFYKTNAVPVLNLSAAHFAAFKPVFDLVHEEYFSDHLMKRESLQSLLSLLLIKLQREYERSVSTSLPAVQGNEFAQKMEQLIDKKFVFHWRARDYAREMNMSVAHLSALCRQHFSKSAETLVQERLLLEIKRLLVYSDKPVKEICFELNFEDPAYFNRFFKKQTGVTPLAYRKAAVL